MRSFFSWVWDSVSSSSSASPYMIALGIALLLSLAANKVLSTLLESEHYKNAQLMQQVSSYKEALAQVKTLRGADEKATQHLISLHTTINAINTQTALEIANTPSDILEQPYERATSQTFTHTKSQRHTFGQTYDQLCEKRYEEEYNNKRYTKKVYCQKPHSNKTYGKESFSNKPYSIDVPLGDLSRPLIMLHKNLSSTSGRKTTPLAHGNKLSSCSASQ